MMQDLMADALTNLVRLKAARDPLSRIQGLSHPWNLNATGIQHEGAVLQAADIDPKFFYVTFREFIKYHMYNTSNVTAYITIIKKYPRRSSKETGYGMWQQRLAFFPTSAVNTPLTITSATSGHLMSSNGSLTWGYPDYQNLLSPGAGGAINPFVPTGGADLGSLIIPRQYGAFIQFFPTDPWPSFIQPHSSNFFNQGPAASLGTLNNVSLVPTTGGLFTAAGGTYSVATSLALDNFSTKTGGGGTDPAFYRPAIATSYFTGNVPPSAAATSAGDIGARGQAYGTVNYTGNPNFASQVSVDQNPTVGSRVFISGNNGTEGTDGANSIVGYSPQDDCFGSELGGNGHNWSTHPQYSELKNTCMRRIFKMYARRLSIPPGKVYRWTLKSKKTTINPERDHLIPNGSTTTAPAVWIGGNSTNKTLAGWGTTVAAVANVGGGGGQVECPSMWGPEWPCRTVIWSVSLRGQTAVRGSASDRGQIMPTELLLKKDHTIRYGVKYSPVNRNMTKHATVRNFLEYGPTLSNYRVQYPIAGVVAGGAAATADSTALPTVA